MFLWIWTLIWQLTGAKWHEIRTEFWGSENVVVSGLTPCQSEYDRDTHVISEGLQEIEDSLDCLISLDILFD